MGNGFTVDPESIRRVASDIQSAVDELDDAVMAFVQRLSGVGDPWGMDMLGMLIGGGYVAVEKLALTTFDSVVESLDGFAERLEEMASAYDTTEDDTRGDFESFQSQV